MTTKKRPLNPNVYSLCCWPVELPQNREIFLKQALVVRFGVQGVCVLKGMFKLRSEFQNCSMLVFNLIMLGLERPACRKNQCLDPYCKSQVTILQLLFLYIVVAWMSHET